MRGVVLCAFRWDLAIDRVVGRSLCNWAGERVGSCQGFDGAAVGVGGPNSILKHSARDVMHSDRARESDRTAQGFGCDTELSADDQTVFPRRSRTNP